jgi:hypothetical protein
MKITTTIMTIFKPLFYCGLMVLLITSCKKNEESKVTGGSMSAKVDGRDFSATLATQATKTSGVLTIAGTGSDGQINIVIMSYSTPGTFQLGGTASNPNNSSYTTTSAPITSYSNMVGQGTGQVVIGSEKDGYVEGTFNFTAKNPSSGATVNVTEGKFKVKLM